MLPGSAPKNNLEISIVQTGGLCGPEVGKSATIRASKMRKLIVPKNSKRSVKKIEGREESKTYKTPKESANQDELVAPLTWAQRLERVFERAALGLILPYAPCVAGLCGSSPISPDVKTHVVFDTRLLERILNTLKQPWYFPCVAKKL
jgi:hypothetical protein